MPSETLLPHGPGCRGGELPCRERAARASLFLPAPNLFQRNKNILLFENGVSKGPTAGYLVGVRAYLDRIDSEGNRTWKIGVIYSVD